MTEKSHAELQRYHYETVRDNANYRLEGMMSVTQEDMMMAMPVYPGRPEEPPFPEPKWSRKQWDMVTQMQNHIIDLENKIMELRAKKKESPF